MQTATPSTTYCRPGVKERISRELNTREKSTTVAAGPLITNGCLEDLGDILHAQGAKNTPDTVILFWHVDGRAVAVIERML